MLPNDPVAFVISLFYFLSVLLLVEVLRARLKLGSLVSRRLTILGIAHSVLVLPSLFEKWEWFALAPGIFVAIYLFSGGLRGAFKARRASVFGAIYIFISLIVLFYFFWREPFRAFAIAGILALGWGDTLAALIGRTYGRHKYYIYDEEKSWEGTLGMFLGSWVALALVVFSQLELVGDQFWAFVTLTAFFGTLLEAVSVRRTDNLVVPLGIAFLLYYLFQTNIPSAQITLLLTGILGSFLVALIAYRLGALDEGGVAGAVLVGSFVYTFGGWNWIPALLVFFITSSLLTDWSRRRREGDQKHRFSPRGIDQVLANGGIGAGTAILSFLNVLEPHLLFVGYLGSLAGVTADTWSTEVGMALGGKPKLIFTNSSVPPGTSGGVTRMGLWGALAGSTIIATTGLIIFWLGGFNWRVTSASVFAILIAGLLGSIMDSIIGAKFQVEYYCDYCLKVTEKKTHSCGCETRPIKGIPWFDNNLVNLSAALIAATGAMLIYLFLA